MEQNINTIAHNIVKKEITPTSICLDATCGNGHDSLFLAQNSKFVHCIDIQPQAIQMTKDRLSKHSMDNFALYQKNHDELDNIFPSDMRFDVIMYNLGYLPGSDHAITTKKDSSLHSIKQALMRLTKNGLLTVTLYIGHPGGLEEATAIEKYLSTLDKHDYTVMKTSLINRIQSPYIIAVQKNK
jgi:methylase of polypeptide subunit release factors